MKSFITSLNRDRPTLALVVPCYNEEQMISETIRILRSLLEDLMYAERIAPDSFVLFVDDGSTDNTLNIIRSNCSRKVKALKLAANVGHQYALMAGLKQVTNQCHCAISLDADLQDDISVVYKMINDYKDGSHVVYGIRDSRKTDSPFKRITAQLFYRIMQKMGINLVYNHADFRLISNLVLNELNNYGEVNLFLRGIFPKMGFASTAVYYDRKPRVAGQSKYPFRKMVGLAINGITSFSNLPLKIITYAGIAIFMISLVLSGWVVWVTLAGKTVPGWASISLPIYFIGGVQLLALGIMGEYLGKIYLEAKARPRFHVEEYIGFQKEQTTRSDQKEMVFDE